MKTLATFIKRGDPNIKVLINGESDYSIYIGKTPVLEWNQGDSVVQSIATGFLNIKKSEGYQSKEI